MHFHILDTKDRVSAQEGNVVPAFSRLNPDPVLPAEDEHVEDAGLYEEDAPQPDEGSRRASA